MKKFLYSLLLLSLISFRPAFAQQNNFLDDIYGYIENPGLFAINQEPGHVPLVPFSSIGDALSHDWSKSTGYLSLNGTWKFKWVENPDLLTKDFYREDFDDRLWSGIKVPGNWEMQGFGDPMFRNVSQPFRSNPPFIPHDYNPTGSYRRTFSAPDSWNGKQIFLRMEAATSASFIWINGKQLGFNEGANEPAEFNITGYLKKGVNTLAVCVTKYSAGTYLEDQDFWRLGGIFRDVYLMAVPDVHLRDYYVTTSLDRFYKDAQLEVSAEIKNYASAVQEGYTIRASLFDKDRKLVGQAFASEKISLKEKKFSTVKLISKVTNPAKWSSEYPNLYTITFELLNPKGEVTEVLSDRIGFKSVEVKDQALLVNGVPVKLNGVNSHMQHPELGHAMDLETIRKDLILMKQFNINCVRTSHYPPNIEYLRLADELGMYIVDETGDEAHATEFISDRPEWKEAYLDRVRGMVLRDRNHASILFWSAGNESGSGRNICEVIKEGKRLDPTRIFMYGGNTDDVAWKNEVPCEDIIGPRYATPYELRTRIAQVPASQDPRPSFMDEYISVEGNGGGGFDEYWEIIYKYRRCIGGAIWDWVSPGIVEKIQLLKDESPNPVSAAIKGRGKLVDGKSGKAVDLSGHDQWVDVYRDPKLDITGKQLTLTLRLFPRKWNGNGQMITKGSYQFGLNQFKKDSLEFFVSDWKKKGLKVGLPSNWENNWHQVTGVYDGSKLKIFIDGAEAGSMACQSSIINRPFPVNIGRFSDMEGQEYPDNMSNALIDQAGIFSKALSIDQLMNPSSELKKEALLWLDFDEVQDKGEFYSMGIGGRTYGLIWPDRTPQPELNQVKKSAQPVHVELVNPSKGIIEITNRYHFTNLNELKCTWQLQADGEVVQSGELKGSLQPSKSVQINVPFRQPVLQPRVQYRLLVSFALKEDKPYAPAGFEVAWDQFELPWFAPQELAKTVGLPELKVKESEDVYTITGKDFNYSFSRSTGALTSVIYQGKSLVKEGAKLNVWRAPLANDLDSWANHAANLPNKKPGLGEFPAAGWYTYGIDNLKYKLENIKVLQQDDNSVKVDVRINAEGIDYTTAFENHFAYTIDGTGEISIVHTVAPQGFMPPWLPKVGVQWIMDKSLNRVGWYGRGPFETYPDRKTGAKIGVYESTVEAMTEKYLVPQDYGCRTDNRWVKLEAADGIGLQISGDQMFNFSVQPFSTDNLTRARYPYQLQRTDDFTLNVDYATSGVGCTAISVLNKYRVLPAEYTFKTILKPYRK